MRTIGVLGGMGPAATADFFARLVAVSAAHTDQEFPPVILYSASQIPDRTTHLEGRGPDPAPQMQEAARVLERAGAELIAMPCNTAHAYYDAIQAAVSIPVLNMIDLAADAIRSESSAATGVGILAATGTVRLGLYANRLREAGLRPLLPSDQEAVMEAIRAVKGGHRGPDPRLQEAVDGLLNAGAEVLLLGCTELPLAVTQDSVPVPLIDAGEILLQRCMRDAGAPVRSS